MRSPLGSLPVVHAPSAQALAAICAAGRPVVLTGLFDGWPALARWPDLGALRARVGEQVVPVEVYPGGDTGQHASYVVRHMPVGQFLDGMSPQPGRPAMFLIVPMRAHLPALLDDIPTPAALPEPSRTILMLGERTFSNLHFHPFQHSLACQVIGKKRFGLYAPEETTNLYPQPFGSRWFEFTRIDRFNPVDLERWPRVRRARALEVELEPGMALFIPRHWWHWAGTDEVSAHVLYYFGAREPHRWLWTQPGRRSLFWLSRLAVGRELDRARRAVEARLGLGPPPPVDGPGR
jgi:hypothetical protein